MDPESVFGHLLLQFSFKFFFLFIYLSASGLSDGMRYGGWRAYMLNICPTTCGILIPPPGIIPSRRGFLNHWTTREVPYCHCLTFLDLFEESLMGYFEQIDIWRH